MIDRGSAVRRLVRALVACALIAAVFAPVKGAGAGSAQAATLPTGFQEQIVFSGLTQPTNIEFAPDGRIFVTEKGGAIKIFDNLADTTPTVFANLSDVVHNQWDRGLLGLALPPNFPTTPYVYILYAYGVPLNGGPTMDDACTGAAGGANGGNCVISARLSRLQISGDTMTGSEQVLINDWCQQFPSHSIGDLHFGSDGMLYVSAGDGANFNTVDYGQFGSPANPCGDPAQEGGATRAQDIRTTGDPTALNGAILRLNPDTGAAAAGNPNIGSSDLNARRIIANGLRNPFRFTMRPGTNEIWIGDVGWGTWEEIDRVTSPTGGTTNFGWPCYEGMNAQSSYDAANLPICQSLYATGPHTQPYYTYNHIADVVQGEGCGTGGDSISGLAFYPGSGGSYPAAYGGALFFADYARNCIWAMKPSTPGALPSTSNIELFAKAAPTPVDLAIGPGGELYYVDLGGTVRRFRYSVGNQPPSAVINATPTSGGAPLTVNFNGTSSTDPDPADQGRLTYAWDFTNDGTTDSTAATASYTYSGIGTHTAKLTVTDTLGVSNSTTVIIQAGNDAPTAFVDTPTAGTNWAVGQNISFTGHATDPQQGTLTASSFAWHLRMQHCVTIDSCHTHFLQDWTGVTSGSFVAPDHEYPSYLELELTVTDAQGLKNTVVRRLDPQTVNLTFNTNPTGLSLSVGAATQVTPFTRTVIKGSSNTVSAPTPQLGGATTYTYGTWSDGGAQTHVIAANANGTYTATYAGAAPPCSDSYGYTCTEGTATWQPASSLLNLTGDDSYTSVPLPFSFPFYGGSYSTAYVDTNGAISFAPLNGSAWRFGPIPSGAQANTPNLALYPFWDDLIVDGSSAVYTSSAGSAPNRSFTIEWRNVRLFADSSARLSFSATIKEDGTVVYAYTGIDAVNAEKGSTATIGIENGNGTVAVQYAYRQPVLVSGRTVTFAPPGVTPPPTGSGTITGTVTNGANPIANAVVAIHNPDLSATTDAAGHYSIGNVPPGTYGVSSTVPSARCFSLAGTSTATVTANNTTTTNISLTQSAGNTGYTCAEGAYTFVQGTTKLAVSGDDATVSVALPFSMPFYGASYSTAYVDTNGVMSFAPMNGSAWNTGAIPSAAAANTPNLALYPMWADLWVDASSGVYTRSLGSAPNRQFVVEWRNVRFFDAPSQRVSFEVVLNENGAISFAYSDIDSASTLERGSTATVGVENAAGTAARQYLFHEAILSSGRGITFMPGA